MKTIKLEVVPMHKKIHRDFMPENRGGFSVTAMNNEAVSFTAAYRLNDDPDEYVPISVRAECENAEISEIGRAHV